jgi:hypothetical protein
MCFRKIICLLILRNRLRWTGHVALWKKGEVHTGFWWGNVKVGNHLGDTGVDGRIILKWIFEKWVWGTRTGSIWFRIGTGGGLCEGGNEPSGSIN